MDLTFVLQLVGFIPYDHGCVNFVEAYKFYLLTCNYYMIFLYALPHLHDNVNHFTIGHYSFTISTQAHLILEF